ncbi:hypothetical protein PRZ48_001421 [Zasmidium cellare]|uniref:LIM zinc-binding domain-containing protein n=1 Tax=Zasmidium cellare TaxID=395010 RepID=A0ABR0F2S3_ZASCE|nr:hypothetical protein PRZ48_001421 [Zasmidium cellare]
MSEDQMGQQSHMSSIPLPHTPPRPSRLRECTIAAQDNRSHAANTAQYLSNLRNAQPTRPSGARPPPTSKFGSLRRTETQPAEVKPTSNEDRPALPTSNSMPIMPAKQLSHRRTDSNLAKKSMCSSSSPFAGRPLARPPSATPLPTTAETEETHVVRHAPSMPYLESGSRWMEKQEAKSLRQALEDMDLEEERKIHTAAQDEAAELVWKHRNPEAANAPKVFANPDLPKDYRSHLRKGSYQRRQSQDFSLKGQRSASDGSQTSNSDSSTTSSTKRVTFERPRKVSPPSANGVVSVHKRRESSSKSYDHLAEAVAKDIAIAQRRTSSGSRRILSGEKKMYMHPNDKIWEDPSEEQSPPKKQPQESNGDQQDTTTSTTRPLPSHVRKNPFARVRAQYEKMERSNSAPTLQTLPPAPDLRHERVEIQRNPPSQSRNPWYMSNEALPPTPPSTSEHDADEVAPKMTPTKDGKEVRGDDIRAATSKTRKDYSPNLPRPTVVSDKPGRPIVSFETNWGPKEVVMEEQHAPEPEPEPSKMSRASTFPTAPSSSNSRPPPIPRIAVDDAPPSRPPVPQINFPDEPPSSRRPIPQINVPDGASSRPSIPQINVPDEAPSSRRPIPQINVPDETSVPSIVLPDEPSDNIPAINVEAPSINASGPDQRTSPTRSQAPQRPLPSIRPLPHHAATSPLPKTKSMPHYTPSIRQSGALCAHCALPIAGRILSAAGERFHPGCFVCHECNTNLECVAFYPEPDKQRSERLTRIRARDAGIELPPPEGISDEEYARLQAGDGDETLRFYCHLDFHELFSPRCKSCKTPIEGEVIVACGTEWHVGHFFCAQCGDPFDSSMPFVEKDGYAWCVGCHTNRYSSKCRKCKKPVTDVVVKALGSDWHSECFVCTECNGEFTEGRYFLRGESKDPVCVKCEERRLKA